MKKVLLLICVSLFSTALFAQEATGAAEKNAGNEAWRAKNFKEAFTNWEKYLEIVNYSDAACAYNTAVAADRIDNFLAAEKYFEIAIQKRYKVGDAYFGKAKAQDDLKKETEMLATLEAGLKAVPGNAKLESMYGNYFLKKGLEAQKAGNLSKAVEQYGKITTLKNTSLKTKAYTALGSLHFNNGASILQKASPIANSDKEKYEAEKAKAMEEFNEALKQANQALAVSPEDADVKQLVTNIKNAMK